jgi:hypothetical protein
MICIFIIAMISLIKLDNITFKIFKIKPENFLMTELLMYIKKHV